ncbi:hypothetical protein VaNZ11_002916 [Volvox africanus]|uniref:Uncharacterized protein n=1 Tax=Volvox africanus TaxID=51714 RepID=A0ABQ5RT71_9CHLO|nr:hypothetical protein VaNZ11_002916 [Volvox africanus]
MPAHQVGSLDSWLESPSSPCGLGRPLFQVCQTRPRSFIGGSSKSVSVEDCAISLGTVNKGNNGPRDVGRSASTSAVVDVADSPLIASNDKHLDGPGTYIVVSRGALSFKRKSLLSEQLRSATSLPLPISMSSTIDAEDVALETNNPATSRTACTRQRNTAEAPEAAICVTQRAPLNSCIATTYAKRQASILPVYHISSAGYDEINMLKSSEVGADAPPPCASAASPNSDMYGNTCGSVNTVPYFGEDGIRVSSRGKSLLVLMSAGSMDADASSACGGVGSLACSSSTGYFSSSSNVLQYYRGDRDDNSNEPLYMQFSSNALMAAAAACTGVGAATCMASLGSTEGHTTATLRALSAEQHKCFDNNLPERAVLAAAPSPLSLPLEGTPAIGPPLITALSSTPRETLVPSVVGAQENPSATSITTDTIGNTESDVSEGCADFCSSSSLAVCSATDLISGSPSCSDRKRHPSTVVQLAVAAHIAASCSTAQDTDISKAAIVAGQCDIVTPCMASAAEAASSGVEAAGDSSFLLQGPGAACAAADSQAPPEQSADSQGLMGHRVIMAAPAGAGHGVAVTAIPAVSAVAAHLLGGIEGRVATAAAVAPEPACFEAESRTPIPSVDPAAEGMKDSAPQAKVQLKLTGEERPKLSMEQPAGQPGAGVPAEPEASRRSPKGISLSNLFPTVFLVPVTHSIGHATHPCGATGRTIQHSVSLNCRTSGAGIWGVEDAGEPTAAMDVCLGDAVNARRSFDASKALSRAKSSGVSGSRDSINGLLEADVNPAMYEGTVRRGLPRKAAALALARTKSQPVPEEVDE